MISLKKYLEMEIQERPVEDHEPTDVTEVLLAAYRSALASMSASSVRACPHVGGDLAQNLNVLNSRLQGAVTAPLVVETDQHVVEQLQQWGEHSAEYTQSKAAEIKELLIVLARTAESVGERDHRYANQFSDFTTRLKAISNLDNLTQVRSSLMQQATELKTYVDKMGQESQKLVTQLKSEVSTYETKLKEAEELALRDALTGLSNRRNVEERIDCRIGRGQIFCVVMLDINGLKQVNDKYGHMAGDNLLQQFAQELRSGSRSTDLVGRWGGDEFVLVMDGDEAGAAAQLDRVRKWVFGDYTIRPGKGTGEVKVHVEASVGLAQWQAGESLKSLVDRADAAMYKMKDLSRKKR